METGNEKEERVKLVKESNSSKIQTQNKREIF